VVITGGSRGLGFALAQCFVDEGARVFLLARHRDQLETAVERLVARHSDSAAGIVCDVRDCASVERALAEVHDRTGQIDVLVNNAGIIQMMPFEHAQLEDFQDSLATHFWGPLFAIRAALPHLKASRGRIVNISSIGGRVAVPHLVPYAVGKFALTALSEGVAAELRRYGISVTTVTPHLMQTGSHRNVVVRGQHRKEAIWFALGTATRLTATNAAAAARTIVDAARDRRANVTPGWPARIAEVVHVLTPELTAALSAAVSKWALPAPTPYVEGDEARESRDLDTRPAARVFATRHAVRFNQHLAPDEAELRR
jgi:NAD(P)-dependent dehydrogenase (short-subunit alcohol dehydrogenase family)